jgi:RHS repeat-associated protein
MTHAITSLHQMRARWYSSYLRRFLNEDPTGFAGGENFYAYAAGNPVSLIDPLGLRPRAGSGRGSTILNVVQTGLDVVSFVPGVGSVASAANALIHVARGNYGQAALSAVGAIPGGAVVAKGAAVLGAVSVGIRSQRRLKRLFGPQITQQKGCGLQNLLQVKPS